MMITNKYIRKLVWGIGFASFCFILYGLYNLMLKKRNKVIISVAGTKHSLFSIADIFMFIFMTIFAGIRLNVGSDYYNYFIRFNNANENLTSIKDVIFTSDGYRLLSVIVKQFTENEYAIFSVVAIIIYSHLFFFINKETEDKSSAFACYLFLGFFSNSLNILRQCIAMMLVISFYISFRERKIAKSLIFVVLSFMFHYSSIFAITIIAAITIWKPKPTKILLIISIFGGTIFAIFLPQIISMLIKFIPSASGYVNYANWRRNSQIRLIIAVTGMSLIYIFLLIYIIKLKDKIKSVNKNHYMEITFLIIGLCINIASIRIWVAHRIALYFYQFIIFIIPSLLKSMNEPQKGRLKKLLFTTMFVYLIFSGIFLGENEYCSYNTIFSGGKPIYDADFNRFLN